MEHNVNSRKEFLLPVVVKKEVVDDTYETCSGIGDCVQQLGQERSEHARVKVEKVKEEEVGCDAFVTDSNAGDRVKSENQEELNEKSVYYCESNSKYFVQRLEGDSRDKHLEDVNEKSDCVNEGKGKIGRRKYTKQPPENVSCKPECSSIAAGDKLPVSSQEKKEFVCKMCQKKFVKKSSLRSHEITHTGETPFKCDICSKGFNVRSNLNVHLRIHTGQRPHECVMCKKTFRQAGQLKTHQRIHNNEKPYACDHCTRSFRNSSALHTHQRTHTGERPFPCDLCLRSFSTSTSLKTHRVTHSGTMLYDCPVCGRQFNRRNNLNVHIKRHNKNRRFSCQMCSNGFVMRAHLLRHLKRAHKIDVNPKDIKNFEAAVSSGDANNEPVVKDEKQDIDFVLETSNDSEDVEFVKYKCNIENEFVEIKKDVDGV